jgi:hypothetical protein
METTIEKKGERVRRNTPTSQNREVDAEIMSNIARFRKLSPEAIENRLKELDSEWDIERTLELNAAALALTGSLLAVFVNKKWLALPVIVTSFLMQHAVQGWCPPLPLLRKFGVRTRPELDREKYALKALRGDFDNVKATRDAWEAVNR